MGRGEATVVERLLKRNHLERETWGLVMCVGAGAAGEKNIASDRDVAEFGQRKDLPTTQVTCSLTLS